MKKSALFTISLLLTLNTFVVAQNKADFYDIDSIQELKISFEQDNWKYILDSLRFNGEGLLIGGIEIKGEMYEDVGIRYRDSRSFQPGGKRNGLTVILNFIKKSQSYQGYQRLELSSAVRDPSMIREVLAYEIARNYMPAPLANYANITINEDYYGLFVNVEAIGDGFLMRNFGYNYGSFFNSAPNWEEKPPAGCKSKAFASLQYDNSAQCYLHNFELISDGGWDDLIELTRRLNEDLEQIEGILDVDRSLWMLAFNNVVVNLRSYSGQYSQNYFLYKDSRGKFNPIIWDLNLSFGSFKNTGQGSDLKIKHLLELDPLLHSDNPSKPLISRLLSNDLYKKMYLSHLRTLISEHFADGKFEERAKQMQQLIAKPLATDPGPYYSAADFSQSLSATIGKLSKIPGIVDFMDKRVKFLRNHADLAFLPPTISQVRAKKREPLSNKHVNDFKIQAKVEKYAKRVRLFYRFEEGREFSEAIMLDDGQSFDENANDQIYGVEIVPLGGANTIEYYIFAENAKAVSYHPLNYMYHRHEVTLAELNK